MILFPPHVINNSGDIFFGIFTVDVMYTSFNVEYFLSVDRVGSTEMDVYKLVLVVSPLVAILIAFTSRYT